MDNKLKIWFNEEITKLYNEKAKIDSKIRALEALELWYDNVVNIDGDLEEVLSAIELKKSS